MRGRYPKQAGRPRSTLCRGRGPRAGGPREHALSRARPAAGGRQGAAKCEPLRPRSSAQGVTAWPPVPGGEPGGRSPPPGEHRHWGGGGLSVQRGDAGRSPPEEEAVSSGDAVRAVPRRPLRSRRGRGLAAPWRPIPQPGGARAPAQACSSGRPRQAARATRACWEPRPEAKPVPVGVACYRLVMAGQGALGVVPPWGEAVLLCAAAVVVWTLSLYVVSRGGWQPVPALATLAMWALALYELGVGVGSIAPDNQTWKLWFRVTWPGPALLPALWLLLTAALAWTRDRWRGSPACGACSGWPCAPCCPWPALRGRVPPSTSCGAGRLREGRWCPRWGTSGGRIPGRRSYPGPLYPLYAAYVLACAVWAAANLIGLWRASAPGTPLRVALPLAARRRAPLWPGGLLSVLGRPGKWRTSPAWRGTCWSWPGC